MIKLDDVFQKEIQAIEKDSEIWPICGGTVSSARLRALLALRKRLDTTIEVWRQALRVHNAQGNKVHEYDVETGEIKDGR